MARHDMDSATLILADQIEAERNRNHEAKPIPHAGSTKTFGDAKREFSDPGSKYNSILNPAMYEALRKKGYSKEKAAKISNSRA